MPALLQRMNRVSSPFGGQRRSARLAERALPRQRAPPSFFLGPVAAAGSSRSAALFPRGRFFLSTARPGQAAAAGPLRPPRRIRRRPARLGGASRAVDHTPAALISGASLQPGLLVCRESVLLTRSSCFAHVANLEPAC